MGKKGMAIRLGAVLLFVAVIAFCGYRLIYINGQYTQAGRLHQKLMKYKPDLQDRSETDGAKEQEPGQVTNQGILDLQGLYPDVAGWVTIPGTQIDHPFVWAPDYDAYLRTDYAGNPSISGAIFMDYRCSRDFTSFNTILYGHNMDNGSMFGELEKLEGREFYDGHQEGKLSLTHQNFQLELVSCLVVKATDAQIYRGDYTSEGEKEAFLTKIREGCVHGAEAVPGDLKATDRYVTLSTCSYHFSQSRTVAVYRIVEGIGEQ